MYNENEWPKIRPDQILNHFEKNVWLLERVFWEQGIVMYENQYERVRNQLKTVHWFNDIDEIFPSELDEEKMRSILDILFRVPTYANPEEERSKFLWLF